MLGRDVIRCKVELLSKRLCIGQLTRLGLARLRTRLLLRLLLREFVRLMRLRVGGLRARLLLLLQPLLLPLLLLHYRGPVRPDTTRATGQSTEGRGGLLQWVLRTSSVSIPGELQLRLLLMLRLLLLVSFARRLRTEYPGEVFNRPCPAKGSRPGEVVAQIDELSEITHRESLLRNGTVDAGQQSRSSGVNGGRGALGGFSLQASASLTRDDVSETIWLVVGAVVGDHPLPLGTPGCHIHRPLLA